MRALVLVSCLLVCADARAGEPAPPAPLAAPPSVAPSAFHLRTTLARPSPTPCTGRISQSTALCDVSFRLSTTAAVIVLDSLLPVERRLTPLSRVLPPPGGRTDAPPGTWVTGFSSDSTFVGLGKFQLRDGR